MSSFIGDTQSGFGIQLTSTNFNIIKNGNTAFSIPQNTQECNMNSNKITNVLDPTIAQDAVTLNYLQTNNYTKTQSDSKYQLVTTTLNNIPLATGSLDMNSNNITNVLDPILAQDASTKQYVDTRTINTLATQTADYSCNNFKLQNVANATLLTDALSYGQSPKCEFIQLVSTTIPAINSLFTDTEWITPQYSNMIQKISYNNGQITLGVGVYQITINGILTSATNINFISIGLTDELQNYIFDNPVQQQCRFMNAGSNTNQCSNNPLQVILQVTSGTRIIALTNKGQSGQLTSLATDSRIVENVQIIPQINDNILNIQLKQFQNIAEFDMTQQIQYSWMADDIENAGLIQCVQSEYWNQQIPDLKTTNQALFMKLLISKLSQKIQDLEQRVNTLESQIN